MNPWQSVSLIFLLPVIAVTSVHAVRVAWWAFHAAPSIPGRDAAVAVRLSARTTCIARSTRGLARAAVWLTCAAGAAGVKSAMILMGTTGELPLSTLIRQHLDVLEPAAIGLGLCALLFAASLAFDLAAARMRRHAPGPPAPSAPAVDAGDTRLLVLLRRGPALIAFVLVCDLLLDLRPVYAAAAAASARDRFFTGVLMEVLDHLWWRMASILATVGVLTWLGTLLESATLRRRLPA